MAEAFWRGFFLVLYMALLMASTSMAARGLKSVNESTVELLATKSQEQNTINQNEFRVESTNEDTVCEDIDEEECLLRRTLSAHTDYIYTQNHSSP